MKKYFLLSLFLLSACSGDVKEELGMKIDAPDEFAVERKPKLDVPPSFKLRAPAPGESNLNDSQTRDVAREQFIGSSGGNLEGGDTEAEKSFLSKAGVGSANENIRSTLTKQAPVAEDQDVLDRIRAISDKNMNKTLVDPQKEKERIEENKKDNKPITEGETPSKSVNEGKSVIEKIFN